jgi:protein phosphatase
MKIAVVSDIHGNIPALEAVLRDIEGQAADEILCLGDLVGKGPESPAAVDLCRRHCDAIVQGNWDEGLYKAYLEHLAAPLGEHPAEQSMTLWYMQQLGEERLRYLGSLPYWLERTISGRIVRFFHAHPRSFTRYFASTPPAQLRELLEPPPDSPCRETSHIALYGDIHSPYLLPLDGRIIANVGSVGNPLDMPLACYALLEGVRGGTLADAFSLTIRRVPYDLEEAIRRARIAKLPDIDRYIPEIMEAKYRGAVQ